MKKKYGEMTVKRICIFPQQGMPILGMGKNISPVYCHRAKLVGKIDNGDEDNDEKNAED